MWAVALFYVFIINSEEQSCKYKMKGNNMGAKVNFSNHIEIANRSAENGVIKKIGYREISDELVRQIAENQMIKRIQISEPLPDEAFGLIDAILCRRPDIRFRIYGLHGADRLDLSVLKGMKHLTGIWLDFSVKDRREFADLRVLCELPGLRTLQLNVFDWKDYSFLKDLSENLEELVLFADTSSGGIQFDCGWLLRYSGLHTLYLGKKAKKNIEAIGCLPNLKKVTLQGIKLNDFSFMKELNLEQFSLRWCGSSDLGQLGEFISLKHLELWRILKLEDISFIGRLVNLETLSLIDLAHIRELPDMSELTKLKDIRLENVPIDLEKADGRLREIIHP